MAKKSWDDAHMTPQERTAKIREEQKEKNVSMFNMGSDLE